MASKMRRHFPDAFKREAVERARTSGLTITQVAEELGLHETVVSLVAVYERQPSERPGLDQAATAGSL